MAKPQAKHCPCRYGSAGRQPRRGGLAGHGDRVVVGAAVHDDDLVDGGRPPRTSGMLISSFKAAMTTLTVGEG